MKYYPKRIKSLEQKYSKIDNIQDLLTIVLAMSPEGKEVLTQSLLCGVRNRMFLC